MNSIIQSPVVATLSFSVMGACALSSIYKRLKNEWPESYTDVKTSIDNHVRENPVRAYLLFRGLPVFLTSGFTTVLIERQGGYSWVGIAILLAIHILSTNLKAAWESVKSPRPNNWIVVTIYHAVSIITVVFFSVLACLFRNYLSKFVPNNEELLKAAWSAFFVAILISIAQNLLTAKRLHGTELIESLKKDIKKENWDHIETYEICEDKRRLAKSVILAEAQQRPRWFRKLERIKGVIFKKGTYGVAQIESATPIGDKESIDKLIKRINLYALSCENNDIDTYAYNFAEEYNSDKAHANRIYHFYMQLKYLDQS